MATLTVSVKEAITLNNIDYGSERSLDIASVNTACKIVAKNNILIEAHLSIGGVAAIPTYLSKTNNYLRGKEIKTSTIIEAEKVVQSEISPISDVRGTSAYKRLMAKQLFFAHFLNEAILLVLFYLLNPPSYLHLNVFR